MKATAPILYGKERLIQDIKDFVGEGGNIPFEHGYKPSLNASEVTSEGIILRQPISPKKGRKMSFEEMDEKMLTNVILELFRYYNYCHLYA